MAAGLGLPTHMRKFPGKNDHVDRALLAMKGLAVSEFQVSLERVTATKLTAVDGRITLDRWNDDRRQTLTLRKNTKRICDQN